MLGGFVWLLLFQLAGEVSVRSLNLPLPGAVVGMLLLFSWLVIRRRVPENLRTAGSTLLRHLMLLLVPVTTGVMIHGKRVGMEWLPILLAGVGGALLTMAVAALTLRLLLLARATERHR